MDETLYYLYINVETSTQRYDKKLLSETPNISKKNII